MLLVSKTIKMKMMPNGEPVQPAITLYLLDFSPNHYNLPVPEAVWTKAVIGRHYALDIADEEVPVNAGP
jgi:hypothetical protein